MLERVAPGELADPPDLEKLTLGENANALCTPVCDEYRAALGAYEGLCRGQREYRDHTMLRVLLELYGERYASGKRARSGLDFEDLELIARDLLAADEGLRLQYAERFAHVLVDEFQDTNPLQNELLAQLERDNLFRVGRREPVDLRLSQRRRRASSAAIGPSAVEAGRAESVTVNFRSRGEVLEAIDRCFELAWGDGLRAVARARGRARASAAIDAVRRAAGDRQEQATLG